MVKSEKKYPRDRIFAMLIALGITALVFCPYLGQKLFSDVVTFQKAGDSLQLTFPAFMQAWKIPIKGGADLQIFNGASELGVRPNLPMAYPLFIGFSFLGKYTTFEFAYILFFAVHMVMYIYCGIMLGMKHFELDRKFAALYALSSLSTVFIGSWYVSFYIIITLFLPTLYFSIHAIKEASIRRIILCSLGYVMSFLGGYVPLAIFSCLLALAITIIYELLWQEGDMSRKRKPICKFLLGPIIAGTVVFTYYLQILLYSRNSLTGGGFSLKEATALPLIPKDLIQIVSYAFTPINSIESINTPYIGFAWLVLAGIMLFLGRYKQNFSKKRRQFVFVFYGINIFLVLLAMGANTPVQYWFYLIPFLGHMHLPIRFLLLTMPLLFLALTISFANQEERDHKRIYSLLLIVCIATILLLTFWRTLEIKADQNHLIIELVLCATFLFAAREKMSSGICISALIIATLYSPLQRSFYFDMQTTKSDFDARSIAYSESKANILDSFIAMLPAREKYRFVSFDTNSVPEFVPSNYVWYNRSRYNLLNYTGYEIHMALPKDYPITWFSNIDWTYVADTRGDFAILDPSYVAENWAQLEGILDTTYNGPTLDENHKVYALTKFIPYHYSNEYFVKDEGRCLDNGYFYCPDLSSENLLSFDSDDTSYYRAQISSDKSTDLATLFYPNKNYHYYLDGVEISPTIENTRIYIPITAGTHIIEIRYENIMNIISNIIMVIYFISLAVMAIYHFWKECGKKRIP